jgi:hypothetical protein
MKTHPDATPWEYPWDSWRDGPHFSASYLRRMLPNARGFETELIKALLADPKLPHLFLTKDYLRRYVVHITPVAEERERRLAAVPEVWRLYRRFHRHLQPQVQQHETMVVSNVTDPALRSRHTPAKRPLSA